MSPLDLVNSGASYKVLSLNSNLHKGSVEGKILAKTWGRNFQDFVWFLLFFLVPVVGRLDFTESYRRDWILTVLLFITSFYS